MKVDPAFVEQEMQHICASVQQSIIDILFVKLVKASKDLGINQIAIAGGVSANSGVRKRLQEEGLKHHWDVFIPEFQYCTDNAAMIAITGYYMYQQGLFADQSISATARLTFNR